MKTAFSHQPSAFRRSVLVFILCSLFLVPAFAQEAFYIYRNDGDFNGFFYDEVIEMRQSKIGVDSIEYDRWVTQEVVLADTIYRIPLAAIDSIGFQQPEIKFNPRVKFMEQEGLCPYVIAANEFGVTFQDLPANLVPQVGDVLIGLPTDSVAKDKYDEGSFSCVVEQVNDNGGGSLRVTGHAVEQLSDVFEQYITVEQIGVDQRGNIHRRIAGCTPDGFPRAKIQQVSGDAELTLINFESTFTRSWNPTDNSAIELSAQIGLVVKFRAAFNVTWTRFMASLSQDMVIKAKPALAMSVSQGFDFDSGELLPCDEILFPAACPIFGINPIPSLFLRGEGKLEAKLNMPQVRLGVGQHYTIDSDSWFPVSLGLHLVPDENKEVPADMLDLSGQVAFSGYVQTGMKFSGDIFTASWIKKIFRFALGTYLYAGPKVSGEFVVSADIPTEEGQEFEGASLYETLKQSQLNVALLSLDLEAKGHFSVFSKEGEKKFFDKNWSFLTDTVVLAPRFKPTSQVEYDNKTGVQIQLKPELGHTLGYCWVEIGVFDVPDKPAHPIEPVKKIGYFDLTRVTQDRINKGFFVECPYNDLEAKTHTAAPIVHVGGVGEFILWENAAHFMPPYSLQVDTSYLSFGAKSDLKQTITIHTNAPKDNINYSFGTWLTVDSLQTVSAATGTYRLYVTAEQNTTLFDRRGTGNEALTITLAGALSNGQTYSVELYQAAPDLSNVQVGGRGFWHYLGDDGWYDGYNTEYRGAVTATRSGDNTVIIDGTYTEDHNTETNKDQKTYTIHLLIQRTEDDVTVEGNDYHRKRTCTGSITNHFVTKSYYTDVYDQKVWYTTGIEDYSITFTDPVGGEMEGGELFVGPLSSLSYDFEPQNGYTSPAQHFVMPSGEISRLQLEVIIP